MEGFVGYEIIHRSGTKNVTGFTFPRDTCWDRIGQRCVRLFQRGLLFRVGVADSNSIEMSNRRVWIKLVCKVVVKEILIGIMVSNSSYYWDRLGTRDRDIINNRATGHRNKGIKDKRSEVEHE